MKTYGNTTPLPDLLLVMASIFMAIATIALFAVYADAEAMPIPKQTPAQKEQAFSQCVQDYRALHPRTGYSNMPILECDKIMAGKKAM